MPSTTRASDGPLALPDAELGRPRCDPEDHFADMLAVAKDDEVVRLRVPLDCKHVSSDEHESTLPARVGCHLGHDCRFGREALGGASLLLGLFAPAATRSDVR